MVVGTLSGIDIYLTLLFATEPNQDDQIHVNDVESGSCVPSHEALFKEVIKCVCTLIVTCKLKCFGFYLKSGLGVKTSTLDHFLHPKF